TLNRFPLYVRDDLRLHSAALLAGVPLKESLDDRLPRTAGPLNHPLAAALVHVLGESADVGFVRLRRPRHLLKGAGPHRQPDAVEHEPCGLLRDAERPG